jgi:hypothetical protein
MSIVKPSNAPKAPIPVVRPAGAGAGGPGILPMRGRPGYYMDQATGRVINMSKAYEGPKFDTIFVDSGLIASGDYYDFFKDLDGKDTLDTNFSEPQKLSATEEMLITRVGVYVCAASGGTLAKAADVRMVAEAAYVEFKINDDVIAAGPVAFLPSGFGFAGSITEADDGIVSVGVPSLGAVPRLKKTHFINKEFKVSGRLTFQKRDWATPAMDAEMPTLTNEVLIKAILWGIIAKAH